MNGKPDIGDSISRGIKVLGENWVLAPVQFGFYIIQIGLVIAFLIIPMAVALVAAGVDTDIFENPDAFKERFADDPMEFFRANLWLLALFLICLAVYLTLAFVVALFSAGGSAGVLARAIASPGEAFSFGAFFSDAKRLFMPLMWYFTALSSIALGIVLLFALAALAVIVVLGGGGGGIENNPVLVLFGILLAFAGMFIFIITAFAFGLFAKFGVASIVFDSAGPIEAFGKTYDYLKSNLGAAGLYALCVLAIFAVAAGLGLVNAIIEMIPVVGGMLSLLFQIGAAAVNIFVSLCVTAICFDYYFQTSRPASHPAPERPGSAPFPGS